MKTDIQTEAVQKMQDYIEAHVFDVVTPGALSRITGYSPWYAARLFFQFLNMTPADYVRRLKLSKSALRLRDESVRITDVAYDTGYSSVDGYQRAFLKEFGCNPGEYAQHPVPIYLFQPYGVKYKFTDREISMENVKTVFVQVVQKPERNVIIKRGVKASEYFEYCSEVGCDVWGLLLSMKSLCGEPVCLWLPEKYRKPGTSEYLLFRGEPFQEEDFSAAIEQVWDAEKKYNPSLAGYVWDTSIPRIQLEPRGERGYIELVPVKKLEQ